MKTPLQKAIEITGSQKALAALIGVSHQTIWAWIERGTLIPPDKCVAIEQVTEGKVTRKNLRHDDWEAIWPELKTDAAA